LVKLTGSPESLRRQNRTNVLNCILNHDAIDRTQLAYETGLTTTAITRITRELIDAGILETGKKSPLKSGPGRNRTQLTFTDDTTFVIGINFAAWERQMVLANLKGDVIAYLPFELSNPQNSSQTLIEISDMVDNFIAEQNIKRHRILGVGFAIAGIVNSIDGRLETSPYLGWQDVEIGKILSDRLDLQVAVENLNNIIAMAETNYGCCVNKKDVMLVRVGPGLGGSFLFDGRLARGNNFQTGQIGHIPVPENNIPCACGQKGCLNTIASGWSILADLKLSIPPASSPLRLVDDGLLLEEIIKKAKNNDQVVKKAAFRAGHALGVMLSSLFKALAPEVILVVGPIAEISSYIDGIHSAASKNKIRLPLLTPNDQKFKSVASSAALHGLSEFLFSPRFRLTELMQNSANPINPSNVGLIEL
jgi:predicted NBD/HSP70 family sugar kinase